MRRLIEALRVQQRVIGALMLRDSKSFLGGGSLSQLWMLGEPLVITFVVLWIHSLTGALGIFRGIPIVAFILTGYCPHLLLRHLGTSGAGAVNADLGLLYHRQVHFFDLILAGFFLESALVVANFVLMFIIFYCFGMLTAPHSLGYMYLGWLLHIWFAFNVAFLLSGLALRWKLIRRLFQPFVLAMVPVYESFSMLYWLPENLRGFLLYFPPTNATEIMRLGYFGATVPTYFDIAYTVECNLLLTFLGMLSLMDARRRLEAS